MTSIKTRNKQVIKNLIRIFIYINGQLIVYYPCQQSKPFTEWKMGKLDMSVVVSSIIIVACTHIPFLGNENICKLLLYVCIIIGLMQDLHTTHYTRAFLESLTYFRQLKGLRYLRQIQECDCIFQFTLVYIYVQEPFEISA